MSNHTSVPMPNGTRAMIDNFASDDMTIAVGTHIIKFEFSQMFGPMALTKTGAERSLPPKLNHQFLRAASLWNAQGKRMNGSQAIWHEPKKPVLKHLGGRHYQVIEQGEVGHDW